MISIVPQISNKYSTCFFHDSPTLVNQTFFLLPSIAIEMLPAPLPSSFLNQSLHDEIVAHCQT